MTTLEPVPGNSRGASRDILDEAGLMSSFLSSLSRKISFVTLLGLTAGSTRAEEPAHLGVPVLVELFTSEGCSSCPPADLTLARLERTQPVAGAEIVPLSLHVDYWNRLGWADPFSSASFSARQKDYSRAWGVDRVYTPQVVVDGRAELLGRDETKARRAVGEDQSATSRCRSIQTAHGIRITKARPVQATVAMFGGGGPKAAPA